MGALAERDDAAPVDDTIGDGKKLVAWWRDVADDDDRAMFRRWAEIDPQTGRCHRSHAYMADQITASGFPISRSSVLYGLRILRRNEWAT